MATVLAILVSPIAGAKCPLTPVGHARSPLQDDADDAESAIPTLNQLSKLSPAERHERFSILDQARLKAGHLRSLINARRCVGAARLGQGANDDRRKMLSLLLSLLPPVVMQALVSPPGIFPGISQVRTAMEIAYEGLDAWSKGTERVMMADWQVRCGTKEGFSTGCL